MKPWALLAIGYLDRPRRHSRDARCGTTQTGALSFTAMVLFSLCLLACGTVGGGAGYGPPPPATYEIGGTVINLAGTGGGLVLQDNGGDDLLVNANGSFTFKTAVTSGSAYNVTVKTQPNAPAQTCGVTNATGVANSNVITVSVNCGHNEWTWISGSNSVNQKGIYGVQGTASPSNSPGARNDPTTWIDSSGNFWLFGGSGYDSTGGPAFGFLNDLWKYSSGQWTWMGGSNLINQAGTYGTEGMASPGNAPGGRTDARGWMDASGNFWLFGGQGYDSAGNAGQLNDLWKYSAGQWTWTGGSSLGGQKGIYGTKGVASASNVPGGRDSGLAWADKAGNFWLFGGSGIDSTGAGGDLNDVWEYSGGQWAWIGGSSVGSNVGVPPTYGTQGVPSPSNDPGQRFDGAGWTDAAGNFWLFGGAIHVPISNGIATAVLNDLWEYSGGQWTWVGGSNQYNQQGVFGTQGVVSPSNVPGGRMGHIGWADASGNFWLFGGYTVVGPPGGTDVRGHLNDMWKYSGGEWTWMAGSNQLDQSGTYGTQGSPSPTNSPGGREEVFGGTDKSGSLWLFGGYSFPQSTGLDLIFNDLWMYLP